MINVHSDPLDIILNNNSAFNPNDARRVLILYEETTFLIGDTCLKFDQFKVCRYFFRHATITLNLKESSSIPMYMALLKNNPYIDEINHSKWEDIRFESYDIIICITAAELALLEYFRKEYTTTLLNGTMTTAVFSMSAVMLNQPGSAAFPVFNSLLNFYAEFNGPVAPELYISEEEKSWANQWLTENGLKEDEQLFIFVDAASRREKLLRTDVYISLLKSLLSMNNARVLVYDERGVGKALFYKELLGDKLTKKILFATQLGLRNDMSLLSADQVKIIIGPCTGLLHCASGIYNYFVRKDDPIKNVPLIITYTGKYERPFENAKMWWGNAPLVNCLLIRDIQGQSVLSVLNELDETTQLYTSDLLTCQHYTAAMINNFILKKTGVSEPLREIFP